MIISPSSRHPWLHPGGRTVAGWCQGLCDCGEGGDGGRRL